MTSVLGGYLLGLVLGLRHAFEPDHLMALSTLVGDKRQRGHALLLGATWGLGHTLSLFLVGGTLALLEMQMPARLAAAFECVVGAMLVFLGARAVLRALREGRRGPVVAHHHGDATHVHGGAAGHLHLGRWTFSPRPLLIGLVHGLAGSGAMTALVLAALPTARARLVYIAVFGLGSLVGMGALTLLVGTPLRKLQRLGSALVLGLAGMCSSGLGVYWLSTSLAPALALG